MSTSPFLDLTYIQASQNQKEVTANEAFDDLEQALTKRTSIAMTDANYTLLVPDEAYRNMFLEFTGTLTAGRNVIVPSTNKLYFVKNSTTGGFALTVKAAAGTGISVASGVIKGVFFDGTNVVEVASPSGAISLAFTNLTDAPASYTSAANKFVQVNAGATGLQFTTLAAVATGGHFTDLTDVPASYTSQANKFVQVNAGATALVFTTLATVATSGHFTDLSDTAGSFSGSGGFAVEVNAGATALQYSAKPYDMGIYFPGLPSNGQVILRLVIVRACSFPASMTGSDSKAGVAATGSSTYTFKKNGVSFATLVFAASGTVGSWTSASGATFAAGDILTIEAPATADATLADVGITLKGTRT